MTAMVVRLAGAAYTLDPSRSYTVGRDESSDIRVDDPRVSRLHAQLHHDGNQWVFTDRSSAGSFVHDQAVPVMAVSRACTVRLGPAGSPEIALDPAAASQAPAAPAAPAGPAATPPQAAPAAPAAPIAPTPPQTSPPAPAAQPSPAAAQQPAPVQRVVGAAERPGSGTIAIDDRALRLDTNDGNGIYPPGSRAVVGRDSSCDLVVTDQLVSAQHCVFEWDGEGWLVRDLDSTRGTWIDGRKITQPTRVEGAFHVMLGDDNAGAEVRVVTAGEHQVPRDRRPLLLAGAGVLLGAAALVVALVLSGGDEPTPEALPMPEPVEVVTPDAEPPEPEADAISAEDLGRSIVQPVATFPNGQVCASGSATHVGDGLLLTNFHVIGILPGVDGSCRFRGDIAVADAADQQPAIRASADIMSIDPAADLAVLRLNEDLGLPTIELSADQPALGSRIRIFGFPGIGGGTLTVTQGQVSGFLDDVNVGPGAWIKTDAAIAGGNSGGAAINDSGQLVGVPTVVGAGASVQAVECRPLADTNGDGVTNGDDTCVSVGGFINGVRPARLAERLIDEARTGAPFSFDDPALDLNAVNANANFGAIDVSGLRIDGFTAAGDPVDNPAEIEILCATYSFSGVDNGLGFVSAWLLNENILQDGFVEGFWGAGTDGETTSCYRPLGGVATGQYVFGLAFGLNFDVTFEVEQAIG